MSQNNNNSQIKKEIHFEELSQVEKGKVQFQKTLKAYLTVILGTLIYSFGVVWILRLGGFFSGGATGASQLIVGLFEKFNPGTDVTKFMSNNITKSGINHQFRRLIKIADKIEKKEQETLEDKKGNV